MADHDHAYKLLFSHRELVADLLRGFIKEDWVAGLDFDSLERVREVGVAPDLREREDDILWRVRLRRGGHSTWLYVYLLLEFQSTVDAFMAVRVMTYVGLLWGDLIKAGAIRPGEPLPPVLPIVLYNGAAAWTAQTALGDLIDPGLPAQLRHWQPEVRYLLLEEQRYAEADLAALTNLAAAVFRLEQSRTPADMEQVVAALLQWLKDPAQDSLRRAFTVWLKRVLLPARAPTATLPPLTDLQELHAMLAERVKTWTEEWKQQGLQEGMREGLEQGLQRGLQQGMQRGLQQGEIRAIRRQLALRFGTPPAWVEARLAAATEAELACWTERVLSAPDLAAVFTDLAGADGGQDG